MRICMRMAIPMLMKLAAGEKVRTVDIPFTLQDPALERQATVGALSVGCGVVRGGADREPRGPRPRSAIGIAVNRDYNLSALESQ
jgi:hypothetical protein